MKICIIGSGNVGTNLDYAFHKQAIDSLLVSSREGLDSLPEADAYIYTVRDSALAEVVSKVHVPCRALHLHTSGTVPLSVFGEDKPHAGILYPLQSFSKTHIIEDFSKVPVFVEGKNIDDVAAIFSIALQITTHVYEAYQHDRERLHVAGVFVNNFANQMYAMAKEVLSDTHIPFEALLPLIDETAAKVHSLSPHDAQTGPARRHDKQVMEHHLSLLTQEHQRQIYSLLSQRIWDEFPS